MWRPADYVIAALCGVAIVLWGMTALVWLAGGFC